MQTHTFKWKLFDVEYSSVNKSSLYWILRLNAEFYEPEILEIRNSLISKKAHSLWNLAWYIKRWTQPNYSNWNIKVLRSVNIRENGFSDDRQEYIEEYFYNSKKSWQIKYWDVLLTSTWVWTLWRASINLSNEKYFIDWHITAFRKLEWINSSYLYSFFNSNIWQAQINKLYNWTSGQIEIYPDNLAEILISIPSQFFQEKIQELIIESYNQKEFSEKLYKEAENLLLSELDLLDYKAKTKNIDLIPWYSLEVQENHSTTNYSILKEFDRFDAEYWDYDFVEIKKRVKNIKSEKLWELINYKKWIEVWGEAYIEESEVEGIDDKKYFVRVSNFSTNWMTFNNAKFIKNSHFETLKDYQPQKWEILFSKDWTAWITYLLREDIDWIISGWILRFQNISNAPSEYIELVLNSIFIQKEIERQTNGALIQHLKITDALNFDIPFIWDDKIKIITEKIQKSFEAKTKSKNLLEVAKKAVEMYIKEDEKVWLEFIKKYY